MEVAILNLQETAVDEALIARVAGRVAGAGGVEGVVTVALVDDARIVALNREHRHRDRPTDVLAYESGDDEPGYLGDVVVSVETAARQAREAGRPLLHEVAWLAAHGVLHLLGHDDAVEAERREMIALQDRALAEEGPGDP